MLHGSWKAYLPSRFSTSSLWHFWIPSWESRMSLLAAGTFHGCLFRGTSCLSLCYIYFCTVLWLSNGLPDGSDGKEFICKVGDLGSIPGLGRSPGEWKGYPLQYSGLENSMDCINLWGCKELDMTERLSLSFSLWPSDNTVSSWRKRTAVWSVFPFLTLPHNSSYMVETQIINCPHGWLSENTLAVIVISTAFCQNGPDSSSIG